MPGLIENTNPMDKGRCRFSLGQVVMTCHITIFTAGPDWLWRVHNAMS